MDLFEVCSKFEAAGLLDILLDKPTLPIWLLRFAAFFLFSWFSIKESSLTIQLSSKSPSLPPWMFESRISFFLTEVYDL
jgi:hypothetical protein